MPPSDVANPAEARRRLSRFLRGGDERVFRQPIEHPSRPTGYCACDGPLIRRLALYVRAAVQGLVLQMPFNRPKVWWLRRAGAAVGRNVHISAGVWIDPLFPQLLRVEDDVFIGFGARIALHEFRIGEFRAGRVVLRQGAVVGGFALLACGVEVGTRATVAGGAVVGRDVPAGATAIGNPARIVKRPPETPGRHE